MLRSAVRAKKRPGCPDCASGKTRFVLGKRFDFLVVKSYSGVVHGMRQVVCHCDCGRELTLTVQGLYKKSKHPKSCGSCGLRLRPDNLIGVRFGRLTIVRPVKLVEHSEWEMLCECDCGNLVHRNNRSLLRLKNSGTHPCSRKCKFSARSHREYWVWLSMIRRCTYTKEPAYKHYGGRGIQVCERWRTSFWNFLADMGERPSPELQLDRIDNDGNYEPGNVRWATIEENANNKRSNRILFLNGVKYTASRFAKEFGFDSACVLSRMNAGLTGEQIIALPVLIGSHYSSLKSALAKLAAQSTDAVSAN